MQWPHKNQLLQHLYVHLGALVVLGNCTLHLVNEHRAYVLCVCALCKEKILFPQRWPLFHVCLLIFQIRLATTSCLLSSTLIKTFDVRKQIETKNTLRLSLPVCAVCTSSTDAAVCETVVTLEAIRSLAYYWDYFLLFAH